MTANKAVPPEPAPDPFSAEAFAAFDPAPAFGPSAGELAERQRVLEENVGEVAYDLGRELALEQSRRATLEARLAQLEAARTAPQVHGPRPAQRHRRGLLRTARR